jgi:hypothetical protein
MTEIIDEDLRKWLDNDISIDSQELKLKKGTPEYLQTRLDKLRRERDEYDASFGNS